MLEEVLQALVSQGGQQTVVQNNQIPNQYNQGVMNEVMNGLIGGLSNQAQQPGGMGSVLALFEGSSSSSSSSLMGNPMVSGIAQNIIGSLMEKFGITGNAAKGVVASLLPMILGGLISKTNDPNDNSVDLGGIFGDLTGGRTNGIDLGSILAQGSGALADGKLDLNDLINVVSGSSGRQSSGGGLLGGLLGNILGK